jgi:hypothetical protein
MCGKNTPRLPILPKYICEGLFFFNKNEKIINNKYNLLILKGCEARLIMTIMTIQ